MAQADQGASSGEELLTLSEVSNRTNISMPTLQRYKKNYQDRIPSVGRGRKQRYPESALPVFEEIKEENLAKRGRPRKKKSGDDGGSRKRGGGRRGGRRASARAGRKAGSSGGDQDNLLTLTAVAEQTGLSYPTLVRYVKLYGDRIPYEGKGRSKRYHPEAVEVFKQIRAESPRGRRKGSAKKASTSRASAASTGGGDAAIGRRLQSLEKAQERLANEIRELVKHLKKPMTATFHRR